MMGRALLQLDETARALDPDFDPNQIVRQYSDSLMRRHMLKRLSPANIFASALDLQEFVQHLPGRLNAVLDNVAANKVSIKVDAFDEARLMDNLHRPRAGAGGADRGRGPDDAGEHPLPHLRLPGPRHAAVPARRGVRVRADPHRLPQR